MQDGVGVILAKKIYQLYKDRLDDLVGLSPRHLEDIPLVNKQALSSFNIKSKLPLAMEQISHAQKNGDAIIEISSTDYPRKLRFCVDAPLILYVRGNVKALNPNKALAVVGTRKITEYGKMQCTSFVGDLVRQGVAIISGLAFGVDALAHKTAVENGAITGAVLGHGLHMIYPAAHRGLAQNILDRGGFLMSEFPYFNVGDRSNFLRRNRLIAGMTDACLIIETKAKGGSMVTASYAHQYSKDVFALPGRVGDAYSDGCHELIKHNLAQLCTQAEDIIQVLGWEESNKKPVNVQRTLVIDERFMPLIDLLEHELSIDDISNKLGKKQSQVNAMLTEMELEGLVKILPGKKVAKL